MKIKKVILTQEERAIEQAIKNNQTVSVLTPELKQVLETAARETNKSKQISLRLTEDTLEKLKAKSKKVGLPYQSILGSLIHQYANGKFVVEI